MVEPLKKRREQDMIAIQELNYLVDSKKKQVQKIAKEKNEIVSPIKHCFLPSSLFFFCISHLDTGEGQTKERS